MVFRFWSALEATAVEFSQLSNVLQMSNGFK